MKFFEIKVEDVGPPWLSCVGWRLAYGPEVARAAPKNERDCE